MGHFHGICPPLVDAGLKVDRKRVSKAWHVACISHDRGLREAGRQALLPVMYVRLQFCSSGTEVRKLAILLGLEEFFVWLRRGQAPSHI